MAKRSDFPRIPQDFYPTPMSAIKPLVPHLPQGVTYAEACAGKLDLVIALAMLRPDISCVALYDIE